MNDNEITYKIRGSIFKVYNALGPGLLENVYEIALLYQLRKDGLEAKNQVPIPIFYDGQVLDANYRADILVENSVILELKSVETLLPIHHKKLITYLKISKKKLVFS